LFCLALNSLKKQLADSGDITTIDDTIKLLKSNYGKLQKSLAEPSIVKIGCMRLDVGEEVKRFNRFFVLLFAFQQEYLLFFSIRFGTFFPTFYIHLTKCKNQRRDKKAYEKLAHQTLAKYRAQQAAQKSFYKYFTRRKDKSGIFILF